MDRINIRDLKPEGVFSKPVYLDPRYILLTPETPVSQALIRSLIQWEFREVLSEGRQTLLNDPTAIGEVKAEFDGALAPAVQEGGAREKDMLRKVQEFYQSATAFVDQIFTRYVTRNELSVAEVSQRMRDFADFVVANLRWVLRIQDPGSASRNYLVSHSVKTTILAVILGSFLKLPQPKLAELGTASLLHEIGMVRLPPQLYMTDRQLSPQERKSILSHPVLGYNILRSFSFPLSVCLAALEHHERNNGQGYPRALQAGKISAYAKIIAVACSYDAVTSSRPYKEAKEGYAGILDILRNEGKRYEEGVIKALVFSLSIFPIGTYVELSDQRLGMVVDSNPDNARFPVVRVLTGPGQAEEVLRTSPDGISVKRALSQREAEEILRRK
jgi:HD-GYP domain-containing protein (c-di-GMP phosphodiesterase class II)